MRCAITSFGSGGRGDADGVRAAPCAPYIGRHPRADRGNFSAFLTTLGLLSLGTGELTPVAG
eukprot:scaffold251207_cov35-Tisochrysis_lutea.AAC.4